jgi:predicted DsbA family dithiol-disulfide isomerase
MGTQEQEVAESADEADEIVVYSDYVCPFCYLGRASLDQYRQSREEPLDTEWHPFDLRGHKRDASGEIQDDVDDGKDEAYFEQVRENVARLGEKYDAEIDLDAVPDTDSWDTQQAALYVREAHPEQFEAFDDALFEAYWLDHRDIGDEAVIVDVAESVGLDGEAVREAIHDDEWAEELEAEFREARQRGVTGVPTFAYENHAARGAVPPEQLERLVEG